MKNFDCQLFECPRCSSRPEIHSKCHRTPRGYGYSRVFRPQPNTTVTIRPPRTDSAPIVSTLGAQVLLPGLSGDYTCRLQSPASRRAGTNSTKNQSQLTEPELLRPWGDLCLNSTHFQHSTTPATAKRAVARPFQCEGGSHPKFLLSTSQNLPRCAQFSGWAQRSI